MKKTIVATLTMLSMARRLFTPKSRTEPQEALATRGEVKPAKQEQPPTPTLSARQQRRKEAIRKRRLERRRGKRRTRTAWKILKGLVAVFLAVLAAVAAVAQLDVYVASRINISPAYSLDPADPFSTRFLVSNDGLLSIYDVKNWCYVNDVSNDNGAHVGDLRAYEAATDASEMGPTDKSTVRCRVPVGFASPATHGDIVISVWYTLRFYPWRKGKHVRLVGERGSDGVFHWSQQLLPQTNE
jgi:hypothetical protein